VKQPLSVGVVGLGPWGARLADRWSGAPGLRWLGAAERRGAEAAGGLATRSLDALLQDRPALVLVATEPAAHEAVALRCLAAGAAVFIEKPPALDLAGLRRLEAAAVRPHRLFGSSVWLDVPMVSAWLAAAAEGRGRRAVRLVRHNPTAPARGLDELVDLAPHDLLLLHTLQGRLADRVRAVRRPDGVRAALCWDEDRPLQAILDLSWQRPRRRELLLLAEGLVLQAAEGPAGPGGRAAERAGERAGGRGGEAGLWRGPGAPAALLTYDEDDALIADPVDPWPEAAAWAPLPLPVGPEPLIAEQQRILGWMAAPGAAPTAAAAWQAQRLGVAALQALRRSLAGDGGWVRPDPPPALPWAPG
jgi:predicted dehydrogenase